MLSFIKGKALQHVFNFQGGISVESALLTCLGLVLGNEHYLLQGADVVTVTFWFLADLFI